MTQEYGSTLHRERLRGFFTVELTVDEYPAQSHEYTVRKMQRRPLP